MSKFSFSGLTGSRKTGRPAVEPAPVPPGFEELAYVFQCAYGHYPWDDWERAALAAGVPQNLAGLGRLTMREAFQHGWDARLQSLCGWRDRGRRMIRLALRSPATARRRWNRLLDTDGYRGCWRTATNDERTGEWKSLGGRPQGL
jgi:hypothetical protein